MGHLAGTLRAERPLSRGRSSRFPGGHHWTAVGLAFCAIATVGTASAQGIWDDPAFSLYRQAVEAMDKKDYARASDLSGQAIAQQPTHVLAYYLRGQAAMYQSRWDEAAAAFGKVVELYPGSFAGHRDLGGALEQLNRVDDAAREYEAAIALRDQDNLRVRLAFMLLKANQQPRDRNDDEPVRLEPLQDWHLAAEWQELLDHAGGQAEVTLPVEDGAGKPGQGSTEHAPGDQSQGKADPAAGDDRGPDRERDHPPTHLVHQDATARRGRRPRRSNPRRMIARIASAMVTAYAR